MEKWKLLLVHVEEVQLVWECLRLVLLVNSLIQVLTKYGRHQPNLLSSIEDTMPRLAFKLFWLVFILRPDGEVKELEGQKIVQHRILIVFSHPRGFELLERHEV